MNSRTRLFVSHSSHDRALAESLVTLLLAAFPIRPHEIRCTSVEGHRLPTGVSTAETLREEAIGCDVLIALLTEHSLKSVYVIFELGARWGAQKPIFPLLAKSLQGSNLPQPLGALNARDCRSRSEVLRLLEDLTEALSDIRSHPASTWEHALSEFLAQAAPDPVDGVAPTPPCSQIPVKGHTSLSARDISERLRAAPPLRVNEIAASFVGMTVEWEVLYSLASASERDPRYVCLVLNPWVPEGFDTSISCQVLLKDYPFLTDLDKDKPLRITGRISKASLFSIDVEGVRLAVLSEEETYGTRIQWLLPDIRFKVGPEIAARATDVVILEAVKMQLAAGRPPGLRLDYRGIIIPEIARYSARFRLLATHCAKRLLDDLEPNAREKSRSLGYEIETLEKSHP